MPTSVSFGTEIYIGLPKNFSSHLAHNAALAAITTPVPVSVTVSLLQLNL
jgi:hypothetical protein